MRMCVFACVTNHKKIIDVVNVRKPYIHNK